MTQIRNRNFMSASRTIEVSQPSELEYAKRNTVNHSFRKTKKKSMKVWTGISSILSVTGKSSIQSISLNIDNETITNDEIISNHFNKFFSSVAGNLVKKIPNTTKTFDSSLNNEGEKPVFLSPISPEDVEALIGTI